MYKYATLYLSLCRLVQRKSISCVLLNFIDFYNPSSAVAESPLLSAERRPDTSDIQPLLLAPRGNYGALLQRQIRVAIDPTSNSRTVREVLVKVSVKTRIGHRILCCRDVVFEAF